jgi:uncharacterized protein YdgA (DUF945 family)
MMLWIGVAAMAAVWLGGMWLLFFKAPEWRRKKIEAQRTHLEQFQAANENYPGLYDADIAREQAKLDAMLARK